MTRRLLRIVGPSLSLLLLGVALFVLYRELHQYRFRDVMRSISALPHARVVLALVLSAASYAALTGYDTLAFRYLRHPLPYRRIAFSSFVSYAFGHSVGPWLFGGGAVRYRVLSGWGLSTLDIARVILFCVLTFWLGFFVLGGLALIVDPALPESVARHAVLLRLTGLVCLAAVVAYLAWCRSGKGLRVREVELPAPSLRLAALQVVVSSLDWLLAAGALYVLLPPAPGLSFARFAGIYVLTTTVALWSYVPAGLGVLETALVVLLRPYLPADVVLGSVVAYRVVYYLLPLILSIGLLGVHEALRRRGGAWTRVQTLLGGVTAQVMPRILAVTTFLGGGILLISGATPAAQGRMSWLRDVVPLPVVEVSHFLASLVGMGLLLLARGIQRRVDAAYLLASALLAVGIVTSLLKGLDYEEASILALVLAVLLPCRRYFYRKSTLLGRPLTAGWIIAILFVLQGVVFLTLWSHKHVDYSNDLWWQFTFSGHASRALRAALGAILLLTFYGAARLIRPAPPAPRRPGRLDLERAREAVGLSPDTSAHLALLGDKSLLFNDRGTAFVMYAVQGRSWVAMGDPVGPENEQRELAWGFRELADRHGGWTVFYQVGPRRLPMYLDLGLTLLKLGEEGRVPLDTFSLDGATRKSLRPTIHRLEREQCELAVLDEPEVPAVLWELREISDEWIAARNTREKRFSLGFFDEAYLRQMPVAVVRRAGRIVAFANVWRGADREELSIDLMRHRVDAPSGVMEYLFVHVMLWGKARGFRYFNLGMAPLSGLELRPLAPMWTRAGALLFRYGEHFYNFEGLRRYKEKFGPEWQPRYLASPGGLVLPRVLTNVATLISGGLVGVIAK